MILALFEGQTLAFKDVALQFLGNLFEYILEKRGGELNILGATDTPASELMAPLQRYSSSGEVNFEVEDKNAVMQELTRQYSQGRVDDLDGVTVQFKDWWFNVRPSNTEPLLRLNVEAQTPEMLTDKFDELKALLGEPVDH